MSPRINSTLIDEPGSTLLGVAGARLAALPPPPPWTGVKPNALKKGANCCRAAGVAPEMNKGVWIRVIEGEPAAVPNGLELSRDCGSRSCAKGVPAASCLN